MDAKSVTLVFSPYHCGQYNHAIGAGPICIRDNGLIPALEALGVKVKSVEIEPVDEFEGDIARSFEVLRRISASVAKACRDKSFPIVISGNCNGTVGAAAGVMSAERATAAELSCIWLDAHDDLQTPDTTHSGYFDGMSISLLAGRTFRTLCASIPGFAPMSTERLVLVGVRDVTLVEEQLIKESQAAAVWGSESSRVDFGGELAGILDQREKSKTVVHLDLDSLDISVGRVNKFATPGGLLEDDFLQCMKTIPQKALPVSLTVACLDPSQGDGERVAKVAINGIIAFVKALFEK